MADLTMLAQALAQGVGLQRSGRHADAESRYRELLKQWPAHPDVLQLLGVALKAQGKFAEAEQRLRASIAANPAQPHVWSNLGNLLVDMDRLTDAIAAYSEAVRQNPRFTDALIGLGGALIGLNRVADAESAYRRACEGQPQNAAATIGLATVATKQHDLNRAEALLREVLARDPDNATALHNLGMNRATQGDGAAAVPLIERAVSLRPQRADMLTSLGFAHQTNSQIALAVERYRQAIAANPSHLPAYQDLARLRWQIGQKDSYLDELDRAIAKQPNVKFLTARANLLGLARRFREAHSDFAAAHALDEGDPVALDGMARMALELGEAVLAREFHDRAVAAAPMVPWVRMSRAHTLLRIGDADAAAVELKDLLDVEPHNQLVLADLALVWRMLGDPRERWLADYERFAACIEVPPPRGYSDIAAFNADLNRALDDLHDLQSEPIDQTLRNGTQTLGALFGRRIDLVTRLRERFDEVARAYARALPDDRAHPFLRRKSETLTYRGSWSARLKSSGFHVTHIHPEGWISSAYYVALPEAVADPTGKQGWFTLGDPPFDVSWPDRVRRYIQPREGMLVLFPSYFYHGTVPFGGAQSRTTIAFDMAPKGA